MKSAPFGLWLVGASLAAVSILVLGLVPGGLRELRELSGQNARQRLLLGLAAVESSVDAARALARTQARVLSERPTLEGLVVRENWLDAEAFLGAFERASSVRACAVLKGDTTVATSASDWVAAELDTVPLESAVLRSFGGFDARLVFVAGARLGGSDARVFVAVDVPLSASRSNDGLETVVAMSPVAGDRGPIRRTNGDWTAQADLARAEDAAPLTVRVELPAAEAERALDAAQRRFVGTTVVTSAMALVLAAWGSQRLARPFRELRTAAERIGRGDLATPVEPSGSREARALGSTIDRMRLDLADARRALEQREAEARALLAGMSEGVFAVDDQRVVRALTPRAAEILRVDVRASLGRFCGDVLHPRISPAARPCESACPIVDARARGSSRAVERIERQGTVASVVVTCSPPTGDRQVLVVRDETDIEAARRARDAFLANVTHELRTPLSAQLASLELIRDAIAVAGAPLPTDLLDSLHRSTLRLAQLVDDLLESVRIEAGRSSLRSDSIQLADVVHEVEETLDPLVRQAGLQVVVTVEGDVPEVDGDSVQLRQVLVNLLANAIRHSPPRGRIAIALRSHGGAVELSVEDQGTGVPAHLGSAVFERHKRGESGGGGLGLGLWIARSIVEQHGGSIQIDSASPAGARFVVRLPIGGSE